MILRHKYHIVPKAVKLESEVLQDLGIPDDSYNSVDQFFKQHFFEATIKYNLTFYQFIKPQLKSTDKILSLASGNCVLEAKLHQDGFDVLATDLFEPKDNLFVLFPELKFQQFNILEEKLERKYDAIVILGLLSLFNAEQINDLIKQLPKNLTPKGKVFLAIRSAEDSFYTRLFDRFLTPFSEKSFVFLKNTLLNKEKLKVVKKKHSYRYKNAEIIDIFSKNGFDLTKHEAHDTQTEIRHRLSLCQHLPRSVINVLAKPMPYLRLFSFKQR